MIKKPKVLAFLIYYFVFTVLGIIFRGKINFIWMQLLFHFFCILIIILMLFKIRRKIFYVLSFLSSFVCFLFGTLFIIMICYGNSMAPNHYNKAILFFWQQDFKVERNDVVAVKYPENWDLDYQINFKRIIGVPGDEVRFEGNYILINGRKLWYWEGAYFGIIKGIEEGRIKEDYYYIKGDAHNSFDSNYIGLVHRSRILGKLLFIIHKGEKPAEEIPDLYKKPLLH